MPFDPRAHSCPYTGMAKTCHQVRQKRDCPLWIGVEMTDPQNPEARIVENMCGLRLAVLVQMQANNSMVQRLLGLQRAVETRGDEQAAQQARTASALERIAATPPIPLDRPPGAGGVFTQLPLASPKCPQ
jgi:hypothetical protein